MAAADYNTVVVSPEPRGRFVECIVSGTPLPGTVMQLTTTAAANGKFTYVVANVSASGVNPIGPIAVLLEDQLQGLTTADAYVTGTQGRLYFPLPGDELLMQRADDAGVGLTIADILMVQDATGHMLTATAVDCQPFIAMETYADPSAVTLTHVMFSGY